MLSKCETFKLKNGRVLRLYWIKCGLHGLCSPHENRPLLCKLYPLFPKVNECGEILGFVPATVYDTIFDSNEHPCSLIKEKEQELQEDLKEKLLVSGLLKEPIYIFVFIVYSLLVDALQNDLKAKFGTCISSQISKDKMAEFYREFEMNLLLRRAWKSKNIIDEINTIYDKVANIWGDFLPL